VGPDSIGSLHRRAESFEKESNDLKFELTCGSLRALTEFRYAQHCPLARATEVVGERWTLLVVRELLLGPKRFSDLKRALVGVSTSVLSDRLARLEDRGVIARRELPPPTPAALYELGEIGRGLVPAMVELARWGFRFLDRFHSGDHFEPAWLRLGFTAFARKTPTPLFALAAGRLALEDAVRSGAIRVEGDVAALDDFPELFDMAPDGSEPPNEKGD
jgi:DNA-binding HxlR family transcriptional regulator